MGCSQTKEGSQVRRVEEGWKAVTPGETDHKELDPQGDVKTTKKKKKNEGLDGATENDSEVTERRKKKKKKVGDKSEASETSKRKKKAKKKKNGGKSMTLTDNTDAGSAASTPTTTSSLPSGVMPKKDENPLGSRAPQSSAVVAAAPSGADGRQLSLLAPDLLEVALSQSNREKEKEKEKDESPKNASKRAENLSGVPKTHETTATTNTSRSVQSGSFNDGGEDAKRASIPDIARSESILVDDLNDLTNSRNNSMRQSRSAKGPRGSVHKAPLPIRRRDDGNGLPGMQWVGGEVVRDWNWEDTLLLQARTATPRTRSCTPHNTQPTRLWKSLNGCRISLCTCSKILRISNTAHHLCLDSFTARDSVTLGNRPQ